MYLVFDIGGTNCRIALFHDLKAQKPFSLKYIKLQHDFDKDWQSILDELQDIKGINGAVVAIAGALNEEGTILTNSPHLKAFQGIDIKNRLSDDLSCPVHMFNDTYLAAKGEAGVRKNIDSFWYLNWGSGIGGSFVKIKGPNVEIKAAEPGHMVICPRGSLCECGQSGCWDALAGGKALEHRFNKLPDKLILREWKEIIPFMITGLINISVISPAELIVMGGGIALNQPELIDLISHKLAVTMKIMPSPKVEIAKLGDLAALYGGFAFLKEEYN